MSARPVLGHLRPDPDEEQDKPVTLPDVLCIAALMACFALAGRVDLDEERRMSLEAYIQEHATSAADVALAVRDCQ